MSLLDLPGAPIGVRDALAWSLHWTRRLLHTGYGPATTKQSTRTAWSRAMRGYLRRRNQLTCATHAFATARRWRGVSPRIEPTPAQASLSLST